MKKKLKNLAVQKNEERCGRRTTKETHVLSIPPCCPVTLNPHAGSEIEISYIPHEFHLEVASLRAYVDNYQGGRGDVRSMEGMIQQITQDCADAVQTRVNTRAVLNLYPNQKMILECLANPKNHEQNLY